MVENAKLKSPKPAGIRWRWLFRRNSSLLQLWLWTEALRGKAFSPELDFHFDNYLGVFVGGRGNYYFFDENETSEKARSVQKQIFSKPDFARRLRAKAFSIYVEVEAASRRMKKSEAELAALDDSEMLALFKDLRRAFALGGILTVPTYGVEACVSEEFVIRKFLAGKLGKHAASDELLKEINALCLSKDPTAAFEERKSFLEVVEAFRENAAAKKFLAEESAETVAASLRKKFPELDARLERHIASFQWVNTEYVSPEWPRERYVEELKPLVALDGVKLLEEHLGKFNAQMRAKIELIERLQPPAEVLTAVAALEEFMWEFDWAKAYYCMAFLNWRPFVNELAKRMKLDSSEILLHTPDEIELFLASRGQPSKEKIEARKRGFALVMLDEKIRLIEESEEKNDSVAKREGQSVFETVFGAHENASELKGMAASPGRVRGVVRVVTSVRDLPRVRRGDVLVTYMTTMEFTPVFGKAAAIVTDEGGLFSHAAIVSREFGLPCVVGTRKATRVFKDGDEVEVDADKGLVRKINV